MAHLKDVLLRYILPLNKCRGPGYDGAAAMSGTEIPWCSTQLQQQEPRAIPVHYLAHSLNLCLQDACKSFHLIKDALDLVRDAVHFVNKSPKRAEIFISKQTAKHPMTGYKNLPNSLDSTNRCYWCCYEALKATLEDVIAEGGDVGLKALDGMLARLGKFSTLFGLRLSYLVFSAGEELSRTLQSEDCSIQVALNSSNVTRNYYKRLRSDEAFNGFYDRVVKESEGKTEVPYLARQRKAPARIDDGVAGHRFSSGAAQEHFTVSNTLKFSIFFNKNFFDDLTRKASCCLEMLNNYF